MDELKIRRAVAEDLGDVMPIYDKARAFMRRSGNMKQWINGYPSEEDISRDISKGNLYVGENGEGRIVLAFAYITGEDPTYKEIEGSWIRDIPYGTIHRIASDGSCRHTLEKSVEYCLGIRSDLRIDTHKENRPMLEALKRAGFERCGVIICADGTPREAFQLSQIRQSSNS